MGQYGAELLLRRLGHTLPEGADADEYLREVLAAEPEPEPEPPNPLSVECPYCGEMPGQPCTTPSGAETDTHAAREKAVA